MARELGCSCARAKHDLSVRQYVSYDATNLESSIHTRSEGGRINRGEARTFVRKQSVLKIEFWK